MTSSEAVNWSDISCKCLTTIMWLFRPQICNSKVAHSPPPRQFAKCMRPVGFMESAAGAFCPIYLYTFYWIVCEQLQNLIGQLIIVRIVCVCVHVGFMNMTKGEHPMLCHMNDDTTSVQCSVPKIDFTVSHFICLMKMNKSQALRYLILSHSRCVNAVCSKMSPTLDNRATHSLRPTM